MKKVISFLFVFLFLSALLIGACFFVLQETRTPKAVKGQEVLFRVNKGEGVFSISRDLEQQGLVKNRHLFEICVFVKGWWPDLKAGTYHLSPSMTPEEIAYKIKQGEPLKIKVTIPEGFTLEQIEREMSESLSEPIRIREKKAGEYVQKFSFLKEVPKDQGLEGFLFPDTYFLNQATDSEHVIDKMLTNFKIKAAPYLKKKEVFDIIRMASLLEKEVRGEKDKRIVSGILWKRMRAGIPLQVDATITYITGQKSTRVSRRETEIDSPYNTYKYKGLPLGPICNPGLESIQSALNPEETDYWYYLSTPEGDTVFSRTLREHNINKAKYLSL